ncbi:MAG: dockerin type I domain-containing protein [Clostridiales bacterium]|nr:dockerin type I domain-containing protein [Clostridiales bacterium]
MRKSLGKLICGVFLSCVLLCVCAELLDVNGAGTVDDPLITFSYMRDTVLPLLKNRMASKSKTGVSAGTRGAELKKHGKSAVSSLSEENIASRVADGLTSSVTELSVPSVTGQRRVTIGSRWAVRAEAGATVLVLSGSVSAVPEQDGSFIDVRQKSEVSGAAGLSAGDYAVVTEKGSVLFIAPSDAVVMVTGKVGFRIPMLGTLEIDGSAEFGETLCADFSNVTCGGTLSYLWTVGGSAAGTGETYTVKEEDIGKQIVLTVSASGDGCGSLVSAPVTAVKESENAPAAPTAEKVTYNSVTLKKVDGMEYRMGSAGTWQTSPVFTGLSENTKYKFYMRVAETETSAASPASKALSVTTSVRAALTSSVYKVDAANGRLSGVAAGTTVSTLRAGMDYPDYIKVYDASGAEAGGSRAVGTGWKVSLVVDGKALASVKLVVTGDVNGDGSASLTDFVQMKSHLLGNRLSALGQLAADLNGDGSFTLTDFVNMKSVLLGNTKIKGQKV